MTTANVFKLHKPEHATDLASAGCLVTPRVRGVTLLQASKEAAEAAAKAHGADPRYLKAQVTLFNCPEFGELQLCRSDLHNFLKKPGIVFDWCGPQKYLPYVCKPMFFNWWRAFADTHAKRKAAFMAVYRQHYSNAAFLSAGGELGSLTVRLPTPDELESKILVSLTPAEVPKGDFRNALFADAAQDLTDHYQQAVGLQHRDMFDTMTEQTHALLTRLSRALRNEERDNAGKVIAPRGKLYASLLEESLRMCDVLAHVNPTGSLGLHSVRDALSDTLAGVSIEALRESDTLREEVKESVDNLLSKFSF
jgi:hypothetical protein